MNDRLRIRLATADDARAIGALVRRGTRRDILPDQNAAARAYLLASMTARAERARMQEGYRYHVGEIEGRLVGVVAVRDDCHVYRLFVSARFQGRGIGRALWRRALADCRRRAGTRKFTLNASAFAVPVYRSLGFVAVGPERSSGPARIRTTPMVYRAR